MDFVRKIFHRSRLLFLPLTLLWFVAETRCGNAQLTHPSLEHQNKNSTSVCFTPDKDCTSDIIQELNAAQKVIQMQAFSFTSAPIAKALVAAQSRGVKVEVILDRDNYLKEFTQTKPLGQAGIPLFLDGNHQTAHNKVILVDGKTLITGSFNFTKAAQEKNAENVLILHDPALVEAYQRNWENHRSHSERLKTY